MSRSTILVASLLLAHTPVYAEVIEGTATAVDGDTLEMTGTRIRLLGIDAPEAKQTCVREDNEWECGEASSASLASMVREGPIVCVTVAIDVYRRKIARCRTNAFDLGQEQLRRGMAVATDGAPAEYEAASEIAKRLQFGVWSSVFQTPADWRAENNSTEPTENRTQANLGTPSVLTGEREYRDQNGCAIKGNRNRRGEWIYHLPGRPYYNRTRAEELFCTESAARAAGYRRSRAE